VCYGTFSLSCSLSKGLATIAAVVEGLTQVAIMLAGAPLMAEVKKQPGLKQTAPTAEPSGLMFEGLITYQTL
jgi:hypothetical protein